MQKSKDFHPSVGECYKAREAFVQAFQHYAVEPDISKELAIKCALAAVWEAARRYQFQLEASEQQKVKEMAA